MYLHFCTPEKLNRLFLILWNRYISKIFCLRLCNMSSPRVSLSYLQDLCNEETTFLDGKDKGC